MKKSVLKRQVAVSIMRESKNRRVIIINFLIFLKIEIALFFLIMKAIFNVKNYSNNTEQYKLKSESFL